MTHTSKLMKLGLTTSSPLEEKLPDAVMEVTEAVEDAERAVTELEEAVKRWIGELLR